jgi:uncharacterized iron-regulated protein
MKALTSPLWIVAALSLIVLNGCNRGPKVIDENADLSNAAVERFNETAYASYRDAWKAAEKLRAVIQHFLSSPTAKGLIGARKAWTVAHQAYAQTEALRIPGSPNHSTNPNSPHSRVGLWPITPAHLDSVPGNLRTGLVNDTSKSAYVTQELLLEAHQPTKDRIVMGFQALEFMIFGLDQYDDAGGARAFTDYSLRNQAKRRGQLLHLLAENLVADLQDMLAVWHPSNKGNHRDTLISQPHATALAAILTGLSDLCTSSLNGTLTKALQSGDPADNWCASSDTSVSSLQNVVKGIQNVVLGRAADRAVDETRKPLLDLIAKADPDLSAEIENGLNGIIIKFRSLGKPMDQLIAQDNVDGRARLQALVADVEAQGKRFARAIKILSLQG